MHHAPAMAADAAEPPDYAGQLRIDLRALWRNVIERRAPQVAAQIERGDAALPPPGEAGPFLQAISIWFQLSRIIDENAAVRDRRRSEARDSAEAIEGSFALRSRPWIRGRRLRPSRRWRGSFASVRP